MGFFNFIETFFFLSLGITFVLILLLVYHFKQRVTTLEQKCDTMFDILNTVVKELNVVRNTQLMLQQFSFTPFQPGLSPHVDLSKIPVSENDESSEDSSDLGEESSDDQEYDNSMEEESENEESVEEEMPPLVESEDSIKIINVDIGDGVELDECILDAVSDTEIENSVEEILEPPRDLPVENGIRVEKIQTPESNEEVVSTLENTETNASKEIPKDLYRRMPLQNLKALVISKGLSSDPSRLKKIDLVRMLEEAEE